MRYVILEHRRLHDVHWDLMVESPDGTLRTWALPRPPGHAGWEIAAELPPHRPVYLRYEGPLSGDRGHVRRTDAGTCRVFADGADAFRAALTGGRWVGQVEMQRVGDFADEGEGERPRWRCRYQFAAGAKSPPL